MQGYLIKARNLPIEDSEIVIDAKDGWAAVVHFLATVEEFGTYTVYSVEGSKDESYDASHIYDTAISIHGIPLSGVEKNAFFFPMESFKMDINSWEKVGEFFIATSTGIPWMQVSYTNLQKE